VQARVPLLRFEQIEEGGVVGGGLGPTLDHAMESEGAPLRGRLGVEEQARRLLCLEPGGRVDRLLAAAPGYALEGVELELTRSVVAGVADHAASIEQGLDVFHVVDRARERLDRERGRR
jgi:hypothetical protein